VDASDGENGWKLRGPVDSNILGYDDGFVSVVSLISFMAFPKGAQ
jgi:hypothetical protein